MSERETRPFQKADTERIQGEFAAHTRVLYVLPTGGGKTWVAVMVSRKFRRRGSVVLVLTHREELIKQWLEAFEFDGVHKTTMGVIKADDERLRNGAMVQVASVQTLTRRDVVPNVGLVIVDEAHHVLADSWTSLVEQYPNAKTLGLTATPIRLDGRGLKSAFDALVSGPMFSELERDGYLVAPRVFSKRAAIAGLEKIKIAEGDYARGDLSRLMRDRALVGDIVQHWITHAANRRTVVFAVDRTHAKQIRAQFQTRGIAAEYVDALTSKANREAIQERLKTGTIRVVVNCEIFCEGWDRPEVKCVILARPTKSLALYNQQAGRIFRVWLEAVRGDTEEVVTPLVLDHAGNWVRFGLPHMDRAFELDPTVKHGSGAAFPPCKQCPECQNVVPAGTLTCDECGHEWPAPERVLEEDGELEEIDPAAEKWRRVALARGYLPEWARYMAAREAS